jgi:hypothetical protein
MPLSKAERYERLSKRAGIASSKCLIVWVASMFGAAVATSSDDHARDWMGVACGLSFLATVACAVTCLAAAILSRFKPREPEALSKPPNSALEPTSAGPSVSHAPAGPIDSGAPTSSSSGGGSA